VADIFVAIAGRESVFCSKVAPESSQIDMPAFQAGLRGGALP